jgi:hypothetical protein
METGNANKEAVSSNLNHSKKVYSKQVFTSQVSQILDQRTKQITLFEGI